MRFALVVWLALCACGSRGEQIVTNGSGASPQTPRDAAAIPVATINAPHTATIAVVGVIDTGEAALTCDEGGDLRFWSSLEGMREPVVIRGRIATDIAIAREHDGHVAAVLDAAHGIELLRIAKDGGLRSRQLVPTEPGFEELAASTTALVARRSDHVIVRLDANDPKAGKTLAPQPGEQILSITARRNTAFAGIADRERGAEIKHVRQITLAGDLAWGPSYVLPVPLAPPIAVSPSGTRIAGLHARTGAGVVIDLGPTPSVLASDIVGTNPDENVIGFLDDERAVFRGGVVIRSPQSKNVDADPWSGPNVTSRVRLGRGPVVADGVVIGGHGTHLLLADTDRARFLGYRDFGVGFLRVTGSQITLGFGNRVLWLDDSLRELRSHDVINDAAGGVAVDDHRLLKATYSYLQDDRSKLDVTLLDVTNHREVPLGSWSQGSTIAYDPNTSVFAVSGYITNVARLHLDVATEKTTALRPLKTRGDSTLELTDPALANGVIAVAYSFSDNGIHIETFIDDNKGGTKMIPPASSVTLGDVLFPIGVDQTGTLYTLSAEPEGKPRLLYAHQSGKLLRKFEVEGQVTAGAVDRRGTMIAVYSSSNLFLLDTEGKERWRIPAWSVNIARFTHDGKTLLVNTQGGLMALDTATGKRLATGCGWGFGMSTLEPQLTVFLAPVVCAEAL